MVTQSNLSYKYSGENKCHGMTQHAGVFPFLDLIYLSGLLGSIAKHINVRTDSQGYTDGHLLLTCLLINILGYQSISHVDYLERDSGLKKFIAHVARHEFNPYLKLNIKKRWRQKHYRDFPSSTTLFNFLKKFHVSKTMEIVKLGAYIPALSNGLKGLLAVLKDLVAYAQKINPCEIATIDQDATLLPCNHCNAHYCYKGYKAYQPMNSYWYEQG